MTDEVMELSCNLDDMCPEDIGFALELLLDAGALDVWTSPIGMKKNRPGVMLSLLCPVEEAERFAELLFRHTTTLGIRQTLHRRFLQRRAGGNPLGTRGGQMLRHRLQAGIRGPEGHCPKGKPSHCSGPAGGPGELQRNAEIRKGGTRVGAAKFYCASSFFCFFALFFFRIAFRSFTARNSTRPNTRR